MAAMFATNAVSDFGASDREGFQPHFIEMQLWDRACIRGLSKHLGLPLACRVRHSRPFDLTEQGAGLITADPE
jgi:hypothetical protein